MNPQVEAALIAGIVSLISLGGTVVVALRGYQANKRNTKETLEAQREQLEKTLAEQHLRTLNERFATAAEKLGADKAPAVRLAGVYAMAGLADDWEENRQTCVDVLCGYLRMPYTPDPGDGDARLSFLADREVRHTVIRVITTHLRYGAKVSWSNLNFDFTGVVFDGGDFTMARFSRGLVYFTGAKFVSGTVDFGLAHFSDGAVIFKGAEFSGGTVNFYLAKFSGSAAHFTDAKFSGGTIYFTSTEFSGGSVEFSRTEFSGGTVYFSFAKFSGGTVDFSFAKFSGGTIDYHGAKFSGSAVDFTCAEFSGGTIDFAGVRDLPGVGEDDFYVTEFSGGRINFAVAKFSGSMVDFRGAEFSGGTVDFSDVNAWSHRPQFDWAADAAPPAGVLLPAELGEAPL